MDIQITCEDILKQVQQEVMSRSYKASEELRNAALLILRGQRNGRRYRVPNTGRVRYNKRKKTAKITYVYYSASAPGEPPAVRTGAFRLSWKAMQRIVREGHKLTAYAAIGSDVTVGTRKKYNLAEILEYGTKTMEPRPFHEAILKTAQPGISRVYGQKYIKR